MLNKVIKLLLICILVVILLLLLNELYFKVVATNQALDYLDYVNNVVNENLK